MSAVAPSTSALNRSVSSLGGLQRQLERHPLRGKRTLQVVGDVGDEVPLPLGGGVEPLEQRVHRGGQPTDLVVDAVAGHPGVQVLLRDPVDLGADPVQPADRAAEQQPDHDPEDEHDQGHADPQRAAKRGRCLATASRLLPTYTVTVPSGLDPVAYQKR